MKPTRKVSRIEPYLSRLYRYAFSLARDEDTASDLVQQCALKALASRTVPDDEPAYRAWLFLILRNAMIDDVRRSATARTYATQATEIAGPVEFWRGDERLINVINVKAALGKLDERDREIIGLVDLAGLSYGEAARVLAIPSGTVMSRISRARRRLLERLEPSNVTPLAARRRRRM